jgi:hypothetical protein
LTSRQLPAQIWNALAAALCFAAELQSLFTWDTAAQSTLIFFDPSRSTKISY